MLSRSKMVHSPQMYRFNNCCALTTKEHIDVSSLVSINKKNEKMKTKELLKYNFIFLRLTYILKK